MSKPPDMPGAAPRSLRPQLGELRSTELQGSRPVLAIPLGSCEQHGPHLPLDTDTRIAVEMSHRLAAVRPAVLVAPALAFGASWEHAGFPGLLSLDHDVLTALIVQLAHSADWAAGLVLVNGHGGNHLGMRRAVERLTGEGRRVLGWSPTVAPLIGAPADLVDDLHAGWIETSVMLALAPSTVDMSAVDRTTPHAGIDRGRLMKLGVRDVSPSGVLGDPRQATAETGEAILTAWADDLTTAFDRMPW